MTSAELRKKFLKFFQKNGHAAVPSSSLIPDDPSVLLTTAGVQQFKKYYTGEADPMRDFGSKNTVSIQKCFRTSDIDEVGDERHLTFFEMLGNFSFGGYFKEEAIRFAKDFLDEIGQSIEYVTIFKGDPSVGLRQAVVRDEESAEIWKKLGVTDIREMGREDNFWGPTGAEGPCGPTTEIYAGGIEIWNLVFNQFYCHADTRLRPLKTPGVDTGMGLERLAMVTQGVPDIFETDLFTPLLKFVPSNLHIARRRIIADHLRAAAFLLSDGVRPSNKEAGYVLRRLLRRVLAYERTQNISPQIFESIIIAVIEEYGHEYSGLTKERNTIINEFWIEREKFSKMLAAGIKEIYKFDEINAPIAFNLYQSFGISLDVIKDVVGEKAKNITNEAFEEELRKHQEISRAGLEKKFGGHGLLLDTGELKAADEEELKKVTRLHTATHLLQAALRRVLGGEARQMGSDITAARTRFDFSFPRKLTPEELGQVEDIVNGAVRDALPVRYEEMDIEEAKKTGALYFFKEKYPSRVKVYQVGEGDKAFSREFCGGPHVVNTREIGKFVILKEEAVAGGVRRIRAAVEP